MTNPTSDKGYTIAEAAEHLGVPKKTLRHVLTRPDRKSRLLREYRTSKKGLITVEIVPPDLLAEIEGVDPFAEAAPEPAAATESAVESVSEESPDAVADAGEPPADSLAAEPNVATPEPDAPVDTPPSEPSNVIEAVIHSLPAQQQPSASETLLIVATYERLLAEKESRLADMRASLDAERETSRRLAEALAREQSLRAEAPAPPASPAPRQSFWARLFGG